MYFYNVLPTKNMGQNLSVLLYSSQKQLSVGDIVEISIRNNIDYGLILSENIEQKINLENQKTNYEVIQKINDNVKTKNFEIKEINKIVPIKLSQNQIQFLKIFSDNTFNSLNDTWDAFTVPFELLTKKQWLELENLSNLNINNINSNLNNQSLDIATISNNIQNTLKNTFIEDKFSEEKQKKQLLPIKDNIEPKVEFIIDLDIKVRIMYIIRSLIPSFQAISSDLNKTKNKQILIVFPEKKYLNKIFKYIQLELIKDKSLSNNIDLLYYTSKPIKKSKETIWSILESQSGISNFKFQIIFSTRSGIFLPFSNLTDIILVDEGNSMYIQDQNSLYYDTREAIFLISKAFNAYISFISPLPSVRLYSMYDKEVLMNQITKYKDIIQKPRKIKITKLDAKSSKYKLFGYQIEQILDMNEI